MRVLVTIAHPAHVHFYKNFIWEMEDRGHQINIATSKKDVALDLLNKYGFDYEIISTTRGNPGLKRVTDQITHEYNLFKLAKKVKPDIITGIGGTATAHVAKVLGCTSIIFTDSEPAKLANAITFPFANVICTPSCYRDQLGEKQIRYNGYHELAYLHPSWFTPNPIVLTELDLAEGDPFIIVRFISWQASHDVGQHGIRDKVGLVKVLEQYGRVLITSEGALPLELQPYQVRISPEKMHDLLYYATLLVSDSQTMTTEAAVLGTPAVRSNSFVGENDMGNFIDLENNYNLIFNCVSESAALDAAIKILNTSGVKGDWAKKREKLLDDKIDVTAFMVWFIRNYPQSFVEMREHPEAQCSSASAMNGIQ